MKERERKGVELERRGTVIIFSEEGISYKLADSALSLIQSTNSRAKDEIKKDRLERLNLICFKNLLDR